MNPLITKCQLSVQALEPFFSVLLSAVFLGDTPTLPVLLTLFPIVGGVAMASVTEVTFNWPGFLAAMGSNITFQSRNVLSKKFMGKGAKVGNPANVHALHRLVGDVAVARLALEVVSVALLQEAANFRVSLCSFIWATPIYTSTVCRHGLYAPCIALSPVLVGASWSGQWHDTCYSIP